jgi:flagellar M-ring protein FliF
MPLRALLANVTPRGRIVLVAVALGTIVMLILLMRMASAPSYTTLMTGLDPAQTGKATAALDTKGIGYELQNNGTALAVAKGKTAEARIALAGAGLSGSTAQPGYELLDRQKLGTSNFQQQVNYQRALEGEIAKTIQQVDGVGGASVQLVLPAERRSVLRAERGPRRLRAAVRLDRVEASSCRHRAAQSPSSVRASAPTRCDHRWQRPAAATSAGGWRRRRRRPALKRAPRLATTGDGRDADRDAHAHARADKAGRCAGLATRTRRRRALTTAEGRPAERARREGRRGGGGAGKRTCHRRLVTARYAQAERGLRLRTPDRQTLGVDKTVTHEIAPGAIAAAGLRPARQSVPPAASADRGEASLRSRHRRGAATC